MQVKKYAHIVQCEKMQIEISIHKRKNESYNNRA